MQIGINVMLWTASPGKAHHKLLAQLCSIGYDLVELPVFSPTTFPVHEVREILEATGLAVTCSGALPPESSLISADTREAQCGTDYMQRSIDVCAALGAPIFCGPLFHPVGSFTGHAPTAEERSRYIERMRPLADYAAARNVRIAIEPLNRFETHFLNTLGDGSDIVRELAHPAVGLLSDTFHQHIEETDASTPLKAARDAVIHVHASENHRGCPGRGQVRWEEWAGALKAMGYDGRVVVESFGAGLPELAAATRVWRDLTGDPLVLAGEALPFVQKTLALHT
ncbi:MAG: sugar phosphate isomerase/epimerase [Abitibacteriaceae bacterium]|nr:sugar phosphate isomerase/epimerase [Abditibacteriaceae bacterium]